MVKKKDQAEPEDRLIGAEEAGAMCGVSSGAWRKYVSIGLAPPPVTEAVTVMPACVTGFDCASLNWICGCVAKAGEDSAVPAGAVRMWRDPVLRTAGSALTVFAGTLPILACALLWLALLLGMG